MVSKPLLGKERREAGRREGRVGKRVRGVCWVPFVCSYSERDAAHEELWETIYQPY